MDKETIKKIRAKALLTQTEFAKVLGVSPYIVCKWETGGYSISIRNQRKVLAFCQEQGIDVEKL